MDTFAKEVEALKAREDAVILAHYYTDGAVQSVADYVGDSFYLAKVAAKTGKSTIVFCGVRFMGESAKVLNPSRRVLLPSASADCPMAHMASPEQIAAVRARVPGVQVVCYINSTAQIKACSDVCVTSSNAAKIVSRLDAKDILFIPDDNLGGHIAAQFPEKTFHFLGGYCPVHAMVSAADIEGERRAHPQAQVLTHPECVPSVRAVSDFLGSTADIIAYAERSEESEFIVCTEPGVLWELRRRCPSKAFYPVTPVCGDMRRITPERLLRCLRTGEYEVSLDPATAEAARRPLERMLELAK